MSIPDFQSMMLPALRVLSERGPLKPPDVRQALAAHFALSEEDLGETLGSGGRRYDNRVSWALIHLERAGLLRKPDRGIYEATIEGNKVLASSVDMIDIPFLTQFESYRTFRGSQRRTRTSEPVAAAGAVSESIDPVETIETAVEELRAKVIDDLRRIIFEIDPRKFEVLVIEVLKAMGYGVPGLEPVHTGGPRDGGIDGEISQDRLGLDMVYVQAKRYADGNNVGRRELQEFSGSLNGRKSTKGIFITSSAFTKDALDYLNQTNHRIIAVDGTRLANLMFEHGVGVETQHSFAIKRVDETFFEDM